jgi:hypothetical protein
MKFLTTTSVVSAAAGALAAAAVPAEVASVAVAPAIAGGP